MLLPLEVIWDNLFLTVFLLVSLLVSFGVFVYSVSQNETVDEAVLFGKVIAPIAGFIFIFFAVVGTVFFVGEFTDKIKEVKMVKSSDDSKSDLKDKDNKKVQEIKNGDGSKKGKSSNKEKELVNKDEPKDSEKDVARKDVKDVFVVGGKAYYKAGWFE